MKELETEYAKILSCWATGLCCSTNCIAWNNGKCKIMETLERVANALENLIEIADKEPE